MKLKKSLLFLLAPILITGCSNIQNIPKEENQKPKIDTVYVTKEVPALINPLDTLKGNDAYVKAKEFFEKGENANLEGKLKESKEYFSKGTKILSQSYLNSEDWMFLNLLGGLYDLEKYNKNKLEKKENGIEVDKKEVEEVFKKNLEKFPINEKLAEDIAHYEKLYQTKQKDWFNETLKRGQQFLPYINFKLKEKGLNPYFKWLFPVESGFQTDIESDAKAVGIGQFIKSTGEIYGLKIYGDWCDERKDPKKPIDASLEFLEDLNSVFNDFFLDLAAYNAGQGRITKRINQTKSSSYAELRNSGWIPSETEKYGPKIYAFGKVAEKIEVDPQPKDSILEKILWGDYDTVNIKEQTSFEVIAKVIGIPEKELKEYNPAYKFFSTPPEYMLKIINGKKEEYNFEVRIPKGLKEKYEEGILKIKDKIGNSNQIYLVKKGDTLGGIGRKYHLNYKIIKRANNLKNNNIKIGQKLIIPLEKN